MKKSFFKILIISGVMFSTLSLMAQATPSGTSPAGATTPGTPGLPSTQPNGSQGNPNGIGNPNGNLNPNGPNTNTNTQPGSTKPGTGIGTKGSGTSGPSGSMGTSGSKGTSGSTNPTTPYGTNPSYMNTPH